MFDTLCSHRYELQIKSLRVDLDAMILSAWVDLCDKCFWIKYENLFLKKQMGIYLIF